MMTLKCYNPGRWNVKMKNKNIHLNFRIALCDDDFGSNRAIEIVEKD